MKLLLLLGILFLPFFGHSQAALTNDSLQRYCARLESNQKLIVHTIRSSGKNIDMGIAFIGGGILTGVGGAVILSLAHPDPVYDSYGRQTGTKLSAAQIGGILLGAVGISCNIVGIIKIGQAGKTMKEL